MNIYISVIILMHENYLVERRCFIKLYLFANGFLHSGQKSPSPVPTNGTGVPEGGTTVPVVDAGAICTPVFVGAAGVTCT